MIKWLNDFLALAETKQFSSAADKIYISQSALSKHIRALENEVGVDLFERSNSGVELTEAGKIYLKYALQVRDLEAEFQDYLKSNHFLAKAVHISIASIPCITESGIMALLLNFEDKYKNLTLECVEADQIDCLRQLQSREADVAVCRVDSLNPADYDFIPLVPDEMVLVCQKDAFPFEQGSEIDLRKLKLSNVYTLAQESEIYQLARQQLKKCGFEDSFAGTEHRHKMLLSILSKKSACALLPQQIANLQSFPDLTYYHIKDAVKTRIGLVRLAKGKAAEKTDMLFRYFSALECVKKAAGSNIENRPG